MSSHRCKRCRKCGPQISKVCPDALDGLLDRGIHDSKHILSGQRPSVVQGVVSGKFVEKHTRKTNKSLIQCAQLPGNARDKLPCCRRLGHRDCRQTLNISCMLRLSLQQLAAVLGYFAQEINKGWHSGRDQPCLKACKVPCPHMRCQAIEKTSGIQR